jgi:hypothetical protein
MVQRKRVSLLFFRRNAKRSPSVLSKKPLARRFIKRTFVRKFVTALGYSYYYRSFATRFAFPTNWLDLLAGKERALTKLGAPRSVSSKPAVSKLLVKFKTSMLRHVDAVNPVLESVLTRIYSAEQKVPAVSALGRKRIRTYLLMLRDITSSFPVPGVRHALSRLQTNHVLFSKPYIRAIIKHRHG